MMIMMMMTVDYIML